MAVFHGYMYRWGLSEWPPDVVSKKWSELLSNIETLEIDKIKNSRWINGRYLSSDPLSEFHKLNLDLANENGFYEYPVIFRVTPLGTVIILSSGTKIVRHFVEAHVNSKKYPELVFHHIKISQLTNFLFFEDPDSYAVSSLSVNVDASGQNLERADYYGSDLGAAPLISGNLKYQTPFMLGIRDRDKFPATEMLKLGSRGYINFSYNSAMDLDAVEHALSYIWTNKFYFN